MQSWCSITGNMKLYLLTFCTLFLASCSRSGEQNVARTTTVIRPEITRLVREIAADNMLKSASVGYVGVRTSQWERYEALKKKLLTKS
jgi:hypothetical protein